MIWIIGPLILFIIFGHWVHKKAERIRAEDAWPRVLVSIAILGEGMASREELQLRNAIEDEIVKRGIGRIADSGSGGGAMYLQVGAPDPARAAAALRDLLAARGLGERASVTLTTIPPTA